MGRQDGFALPLVLWLMVAMISTVTLLALSATDRHLNSRALSDRVAGEYAALAGVYYGVAQMDSRHGNRRWRPDGARHQLQFGDHNLMIEIRDESGKLDLNAVDVDVLRALMDELQISEDQAHAVVEGVSEARLSRSGVQSGIDSAQTPPLTQFRSVEELGQLTGVSAGTLTVIAPYLTVHSGLSSPNSLVADTLVRSALERAGRQLQYAEADQIEGSGTYDVSVDATSINGVRARAHAVLRSSPRYDGSLDIKWLVWEHGRWKK